MDRSRQIVGQRLSTILEQITPFRTPIAQVLAETADAIGMASTAELESFVRGEDDAPFAVLERFAEVTGAHPDWLKFGSRAPFASLLPDLYEAHWYLDSIVGLDPERIVFARSHVSQGHVGLVLQLTKRKYAIVPRTWHLSSHVGAGGQALIESFYDLIGGLRSRGLTDRCVGLWNVEHGLFTGVFEGTIHAGRLFPPGWHASYWWTDFRDVEQDASTVAKYERQYGSEFTTAQAIVADRHKEAAKRAAALPPQPLLPYPVAQPLQRAGRTASPVRPAGAEPDPRPTSGAVESPSDRDEILLGAVGTLAQDVRIVVLTVNDRETDAVLEQLRPLLGRAAPLRVLSDRHIYTVGALGAFAVAHVRCAMGSSGRDSATLAVKEALQEWPRTAAVLAVGVAFGRDPQKQKLGDVLVSQTVIMYEPARVGDGPPVPRGPIVQAGRVLLNRFINRTHWDHRLPSGERSEVHFGQVLSGEKLIADVAFRDRLFATYGDARGGEMEGTGVAAACDSEQIQWIIVKGIADWADPAKDADAQTYAARAAVALCAHVLAGPDRLRALGVDPVPPGPPRGERPYE